MCFTILLYYFNSFCLIRLTLLLQMNNQIIKILFKGIFYVVMISKESGHEYDGCADNNYNFIVNKFNHNMEQLISVFKNNEEDQLLKVTQQRLRKMIENKKETPSLMIPKNLQQFVKTTKYLDTLKCVFRYCKMFNSLMIKYAQLKQIMSNRVGQTVILQKEKDELEEMQKQLSFHYAVILLQNTSKSTYKDQFFFETLIYLISRVMRQFFNRDQFIVIEEEINRLFRTNRYNLIKKRHLNDKLMKNFPILKIKETNKNKSNSLNSAYIDDRIQKIGAYRQLEKLKKQSISQPHQDYASIMAIKQFKDDQQRSPLLCSWLPSKKYMLHQFVHPPSTSLQPLNGSFNHY